VIYPEAYDLVGTNAIQYCRWRDMKTKLEWKKEVQEHWSKIKSITSNGMD